jgi:SAM-dependent methyltransferase
MARTLEYLHEFYPESRFGDYSDRDGSIAFYARINELLQPSFSVLDFGCGRGAGFEDRVRIRRDLRILRGKVERVIGIDIAPAGNKNPIIDEFRLLQDRQPWPVADNSIDLLVSDHTLEHLSDPDSFFSEAWRVLKQGGYICLRTPNKFSYIGLGSHVMPNSVHPKVLAKVMGLGCREDDVFPVLYRCNSAWTLRRKLQRQGFISIVYAFESEPNYLGFSKAAYWFGVFYQRFAPPVLRSTLFAFGRKPQRDVTLREPC